jgi:glycosyltransferase involved in cell wall biosynthesis
MKPYLSILIPTWNRTLLTIEAIKSVGIHECVEVIVVDDCSEIEEYNKLQELLENTETSTVKLYRNDMNIGMVRNINRCMSLATGDFFGLIGSDDYYKPDAISHVLELLPKLEPSLVVYSRSVEIKTSPPGHDTAARLRQPSGSGNFWHRSIYEDLGGFDERLTIGGDPEYWPRIVVKYPLVEWPERFCVVREHENNLMWTVWREPDKLLKQVRLIEQLNMVHRGQDTTDYDMCVEIEGTAVWKTIVYIMQKCAMDTSKQDIFDMYLPKAEVMATTQERKDRLDWLKKRRM